MFGALSAAFLAYDLEFLQKLPEGVRRAEMHRRKMARIMDKDGRMSRRLNRRRSAIWAKWWGLLGGLFLALVSIPLGWAILCYVWSVAIKATLS